MLGINPYENKVNRTTEAQLFHPSNINVFLVKF